MILRDVILSDQRRTLDRALSDPRRIERRPEEVPRTADTSPAARSTAAEVAPVPSAAAMAMVAHDSAPRVETREAKLSFEAVAAWLAVQDGETRSACSSILADELTHVHEAAKNEGLALGRAKGEQEARQSLNAVHALLRQVVEAAEAAFAAEQAKLADQCVDVVVEAFTKIAGGLLMTRTAAIGAVTQVLGRVKEGRELTIRVAPADCDSLKDQEAQLAGALAGRKFSIVADARVDLGGCMVESKLGNLDGRLEVQLRELFETLKAAKAAAPEA